MAYLIIDRDHDDNYRRDEMHRQMRGDYRRYDGYRMGGGMYRNYPEKEYDEGYRRGYETGYRDHEVDMEEHEQYRRSRYGM